MKLLLVIAFLLPCWSLDADERPKELVLVSYCMGPHVRRFNLLSLREFTSITSTHTHDEGDFPNSSYLPGAAALKRVLETVPRGSVIHWRDWKPAGTCYPPQDVITDLKSFATARGVDLRLPTDEPTNET
jgi:hypothetical protein